VRANVTTDPKRAIAETMTETEAPRYVTWPLGVTVLLTVLGFILGLVWNFHATAKAELLSRQDTGLNALKELMQAEFRSVREQLADMKEERNRK
jgi:Tfp pilus assembly protein PilO